MRGKRKRFGKFVIGMAGLLGGVLSVRDSDSLLAAGYVLPDTGQTQCYQNRYQGAMECPKPGERFHGQDGNYQGRQPAYRDNGDGTVKDLNTGLMWQQDDAQNTTTAYSWPSAGDYCTTLSLAGHTDWRLPSVSELVSLIYYPGGGTPTINTAYFPGCLADFYWSETTYAMQTDYAWGVYFGYANLGYGDKSYAYYVRCVRGGL